MFFGSKTVEALVNDHDVLRKEIKILQNSDLSIKQRRDSLARLIPHLVSHSEREEKVVYKFMKTTGDIRLREMAFEGEEEHKIVESLVEELEAKSFSDEEWSAKLKVLAELVEHHVNEEESDVFPILKSNIDGSMDEELCLEYQNEIPTKLPKHIRAARSHPELGRALLTILLSLMFGFSALAEETTMEKVETKANKASDSVKDTYRDTKDKACEMINGKLECIDNRAKSKVKEISDKTKTKAKEIKNKVD